MSRATSRIGRILALVALGGWSAAFAGAPKHQPKPPDDFVPLDRVIVMTTQVPETRPLTVLDLSTGFALNECPSGLWKGKVIFVGGIGGDIEYEGQLWRCFPFGEGIARYPNDTEYRGTVNSYVDATIKAALVGNTLDAPVIDADSARVAVREGRGTATRADGKPTTGVFRRGEAFDPDPKQPDQRLTNYDGALSALLALGVAAERKAEEERLAEEARKAEEARRAEEARLAEETRKQEEARLAELALAEAARLQAIADAERIAAAVADTAQVRAMLDGSQPLPLAESARKSGTPGCVNALASQRKFLAAVNQRRPADADLLADFQTTLYQLDSRIKLLDKVCTGQPEYGEYALDMVAKDRLNRACLAHATAPEQCAPDIAW